MVNVPGYTHVGNYRPTKKGGGVSILLNNNISFKRHKDLDIFEEGLTESVFIEMMAKNGKRLVAGNMYKPLNSDPSTFSTHLKQIVANVKNTKGKTQPELIIGMDHNMDLLKGLTHHPTCSFMDKTAESNLLPTITCPSRITTHSATLTDNIYISEELHHSFDSALLINDISDHLLLITMLRQTRIISKEPLTLENRCLNNEKLKDINDALMNIDWIGLLSGTTDEKFNEFCAMVNEALDKVVPKITVRISAKQRYIKPWMMKGLEKSSVMKMKFYKSTLSPKNTLEDVITYKTHRQLYNKLKHTTKEEYYREKCLQFKKNSKRLWGVIKETIKKVKHKGSIIPYITVDSVKLNKPKDTANNFGSFFSKLGSTLAAKIVPCVILAWALANDRIHALPSTIRE